MRKTPIMGKAVATAEQMAAYVLSVNPSPKLSIPILQLARLFLIAGEIEGVRGDLEFARSCHETGNFSFPATVTPDQKNFCGHGTTSATNKGSYFIDEFYSALVQIQHAKAYATSEPLNYECIDNRYKYVDLGCAPTMEQMGGKWAVPGYAPAKYNSLQEAIDANDSYGHKVVKILDKILATDPNAASAPEPMPEPTEPTPEVNTDKPLAGKVICLDPGHYKQYNMCPAIPEYYESEVMWEFTLLEKKYLEELGATVRLTRIAPNLNPSLKQRGAASEGCDLLISNHSNAVGGGMNESIDYAAVYCLVPDDGTNIDEVSREIALKLAPTVAECMDLKQGGKVLTRKSTKDHNNDGVLNDNYYTVLSAARLVGTPALIVEHSFHTNTKSVRWLLNRNNLDELARREAQVIAEYFAGKPVETPAPAKKKLYKVQVGAFSSHKSAEDLETKLEAAGFDAVIVVSGGMYKVQTGAFESCDNAVALSERLKAAGFKTYITETA